MQQGLIYRAFFAFLLFLGVLTPDRVLAGDPIEGKAKARACIVCHAMDGRSEQPDSPHLSGQVELYLVEQMRAYRSGKRKHKVMSIVAAPLSDADIDDLAAWYASIKIAVTPVPTEN